MTALLVVLLHGKRLGGNHRSLRKLTEAIVKAGHIAIVSDMAWSARRIYAMSVNEALDEIDQKIADVRADQENRVVVAGHSLGGNVAIRYAATRDNIAGVIAMAPAHNPDRQHVRDWFAPHLKRAQDYIDSGRGDEPMKFPDHDGTEFEVDVTPRNYKSWCSGGDEGALVMPRNVRSFRRPIPFLYIYTTKDQRINRPKGDIFDQAPSHPLSEYLEIQADHLEVPGAACDTVVSWLAKL